ncbi:replication initiation protein, partial [Pasteurella multocida]
LSLAKLDNRDITQSKVTLYVKDYAESFGLSETSAYTELQKASKRLYDRSIILHGEDETTEFRWIESRTRYHKGEGRISFEFSRRVIPYLFELDKRLGYTQYHLLSVSGFNSVYSIRLYELCKKIQGMANQVVDVDDIRRILMLEDKYSQYRELNKFVLKVAIAEINAKSDLFVSFEPIKRGRTITALKFTIQVKKNTTKTEQKRRPFPHKNKFGKFVKLDKQNPKMSSHEYGEYA